MGCEPYWTQVNVVSNALRTLTRAGLLPDNPAIRELEKARAGLLMRVKRAFPRIPVKLLLPLALSPARITPYLDPEFGWIVEQREFPTASPTYRMVSEQEAIALLQDKPPRELLERLSRPVEAVDN